MNTPVSFEIAKALEDKGFNENTLESYVYRGIEHQDPSYKGRLTKNKLRCDIPAPTIAEVVMWLYEKHNIWIYVDSHEFGKWCYYYRYNRPRELSSKITENGQFGLDDYNSPTEAYEAAIDYCLKELIDFGV